MPEIPAVCSQCRNFSPSGYGFDPGTTGVEADFYVPSSATVSRPCPICRGRGRVLGGTYRFARDTMRFLQGPERTVDELKRFADILRPVVESGASVEEARAKAHRELSGEVARLADEMSATRDADERRFRIQVVLTIIGLLISAVLGNNVNIQNVSIDLESVLINRLKRSISGPVVSP